MTKQLTITSKEISSLNEMDELFKNYCKENRIHLDFTKSHLYNGYSNTKTGDAFEFFMYGVFRAIGEELL